MRNSTHITIEQKAVTESGDVPVNQEPTYDGEAPYVTVEEQEVVLPAVASGRFFVNFKSNLMEEPAIALELPGEEEGEEYVAAIRGALMCTPDENSQLELEVFPNILDKERRNILRFMTHDNEQLAVVVLRQERGAVCQLLDTAEVRDWCSGLGQTVRCTMCIMDFRTPGCGRKRKWKSFLPTATGRKSFPCPTGRRSLP